jgi:hypothetical protein
MSHGLINELENRLHNWWDTLRTDSARLRTYQQSLVAMRKQSPRPRLSVALTLRQCSAARKMCRHSASVIGACKSHITNLVTKDMSLNNFRAR